MASKRVCGPLRTIWSSNTARSRWKVSAETTCPATNTRSMASEAAISTSKPHQASVEFRTIPSSAPYILPAALAVPHVPSHIRNPRVLTTIHQFPTLEPVAFLEYPSAHLSLPFRRDLLHKAVVYEGDKHRGWSTASTKWRSEVHGSGRKLRPQKGTGRARLGDRGSPMLRGGGVAFGPKPRDFTSGLPKKLYDIAWRTALSYRYKRGELVVVDNTNLAALKEWSGRADDSRWHETSAYYVKHLFDRLGWGNANGRSMVVTKAQNVDLEKALEIRGDVGRARSVKEIDIKNLLEMGRIVIEKQALDHLLISHQSDLKRLGIPLVGMTPEYQARKREVADLQQALLHKNVTGEELLSMMEADEVSAADMEEVADPQKADSA